MITKLRQSELAYIDRYSEKQELKEVIRYRDDRIKNMYMHNLTYIKEGVDPERLPAIIAHEIEYRKSEGADFLMVVMQGVVDQYIIDKLPETLCVDTSIYMGMEPSLGLNLRANEGGIVLKADNQDVIEQGRKVDILANHEAMELWFSIDRIARKIEVYTDESKNIDFYVCYKDKTPIGNVEYAPYNSVVKIEDFGILPEYQKQGFGSYIIKELCCRAEKEGKEFVYVITDEEDSAKEMYKKCGMEIVGRKTGILIKF